MTVTMLDSDTVTEYVNSALFTQKMEQNTKEQNTRYEPKIQNINIIKKGMKLQRIEQDNINIER